MNLLVGFEKWVKTLPQKTTLEFTHFLTSADSLQKNDKKMRHPFDGFR